MVVGGGALRGEYVSCTFCAAVLLEMLLPQIERDHFDWEAGGRALSYKNPRKIEKVCVKREHLFILIFFYIRRWRQVMSLSPRGNVWVQQSLISELY